MECHLFYVRRAYDFGISFMILGIITVFFVCILALGAHAQNPQPNPIAPNQPCTDNSNRIANTHYVQTCSPGASGAVQETCASLTADEINHLSSAPVTLIPAPGADYFINPIVEVDQYVPGTASFGFGPNGDPGTGYGNLPEATGISTTLFTLLNAHFTYASTITQQIVNGQTTSLYGPGDQPGIQNEPVLIDTGVDGISYGGIASATVDVGGAGYAIGDTGYVVGEGDSDALYTVTAVSGGAVTGFTVTPGTSYGVQSDVATTVETGSGDGNFTVNVTAITPGNGSAQVCMLYTVQQLIPGG